MLSATPTSDTPLVPKAQSSKKHSAAAPPIFERGPSSYVLSSIAKGGRSLRGKAESVERVWSPRSEVPSGDRAATVWAEDSEEPEPPTTCPNVITDFKFINIKWSWGCFGLLLVQASAALLLRCNYGACRRRLSTLSSVLLRLLSSVHLGELPLLLLPSVRCCGT